MTIYSISIAITLAMIIPLHLSIAINLFKARNLNKYNLQCCILLITTIIMLLSYLIEKFYLW